MTNSIFDQTDETINSTTEIPSYKDLLVGEGKKFKDDEALARGKYESDRFVESLQRELRETRQELHTRLNMEELVSNIGKNASTSVATAPVLESNPNPNPVVTPTKAVVDPNEVATIVRNTMTQEQTKLAQDKNLTYVASQLKQAWGDSWVDKLKTIGRSLDMTETQMDTLAKTTPKVLLSSVLKDQQKVSNESFTSPRNSIQSGLYAYRTDDKGWAAYEKLRKENPREYHTERVQLQLHKDVAAGKVILPSN